MKKSNGVFYGIIITIFIAIISQVIGHRFHLPFDFFAKSFEGHTIILVLSLLSIFIFTKQGFMSFPCENFKLNKVWKPILVTIAAFVLLNILMSVILLPFGLNPENKMAEMLTDFGPLKVFLFVFIYASVSEEFLFRGFLLNMLSPLKSKGITIFKVRISLSVIISAVLFGAFHLVWLFMGADILFVIRLFIITTTLGLIAGYYYEKNGNFLYAIIIHATGNLPAMISLIFLNQ